VKAEADGSPYDPPATCGEDTLPPKSNSSGPRKIGCGISAVCIVLIVPVFYLALFWSWASGAGSPPNAEQLKKAGELATIVSGILFIGALGGMLVFFYPRK
jgi:hypothetical protein